MKEKGINRKKIVYFIVVLILIIVGFVIYNSFKTDNSIKEQETQDPRDSEGSLRTQAIQQHQEFVESASKASQATIDSGVVSDSVSNNPYTLIELLDKEKCSELLKENLKTICINGIDFVEKAIAANDESLCFDFSDESININVRVRTICRDKIQEQ